MTAKSIILNIGRDTYSMINNDMIYIENFNPSLLEIKNYHIWVSLVLTFTILNISL